MALSAPIQLIVTTLEDERNYFTDERESPLQFDSNAILPPGMYRVIEGVLYRIVKGTGP